MSQFMSLMTTIIFSKSNATNLNYIAGIDGLRGIAVLSVMLGHFGLPGFNVAGGYGVDVFFVLSGYLITNSLLSDLAAGRPIAHFYWNRVTRLLPALLVVCASLFFIPAAYLTTYGASLNALGALTWTTNWTRAFPVIGWASYMAHTWSLSVEEQFYLIWPLILMTCHRFGKAVLRNAIFILCAASLVWLIAMLLGGASEGRLYNGFDTRCYGILIGACLSLFPAGLGHRTIALAAFIGYFCLVFLVPWSAIGSVCVCLTAIVLIDTARTQRAGGVVRAILNSRPLVVVGVISYSAYLWHWPIYYFSNNILAPKMFIAAFGIVISLVLAYMTWIFVETPAFAFRRSVSPSFKLRAGRMAFAVSLVSLVGGLVFFYCGFLTTAPY